MAEPVAAPEPAAPRQKRVVRVKVVQAADVRLRHGRLYQFARRVTLTLSVLTVGLVPLAHLRAVELADGGHLRGGGWATLLEALPRITSPPIVGAPTAADLFSLEFLDPVLAASVLASSGPSVALLASAALALTTVVLLGRFFCAWLCPYVPILAVSNAVRALLARLGVAPPDRSLPRRSARGVLAVFLVASAITGSQLIPLVYPPAVISREVFRATFFGGLGAGAVFIAVVFLFDTFVARAGFCRYLCPGGAFFGLLGGLSPIRVRRVAKDCTDCTLCDQVCNMLQSPMTDAVDSGCDRCGKCVASCPTKALSIGVRAASSRGAEPSSPPRENAR